MKISPKQYARSLMDLSQGLSEAELNSLIKRFIIILKNRHDLSKSEQIIAEFESLKAEQDGEIKAELLSARSLSTESKNLITEYLRGRLAGVNVTWQEKIDRSLLGGFVLRYQGFVLDGSLKTNLNKFKKQLLIK